MTVARPDRRERLRAGMTRDIRRAARMTLAVGGPEAVSLRAIARQVGVTPAAIYRYFPNRSAIIGGLRDEILDDLCAAVDAARDRMPGDDPGVRLREMARVFRRWAVGRPAEFGLVFAPTPPGGQESGQAPGPGVPPSARLAATFLAEYARLDHHRPASQVSPQADQAHGDTDTMNPAGPSPAIPARVLAGFLSVWAKLYGLVALEVCGHMRWALPDTGLLFEAELVRLAPAHND